MNVVLPIERQNKMKKRRFSDEEKMAILKEVRARDHSGGDLRQAQYWGATLSRMEA